MHFQVSAAFAILLWSLFPVVATGVQGVSPFMVAISAQSLALVSYAIYLAVRGGGFRGIYRAAIERPKLILLSGLCNAVEYAAFFAALQWADPLATTVLFEVWVIFLVLSNTVLERTSLTGKEIFLIVIAFLGAALAVTDPSALQSSLRSFEGLALLGLLAAFCAGLKASLNARISEDLAGWSAGTAALLPHFLTGQVALGIYILLAAASFALHGGPPHAAFQIPDVLTSDMTRIAFVGILIMGVGNPVFIHALRQRPSEAHAAIFYLTPVLAGLWLIVSGKASLGVHTIIGGVLVLGSAVTLSLLRR